MMKNNSSLLSTLALLACAFVLTGCLSRPALNPQTFSFGLPAGIVTNFVAGQPVLALKKLEVASPYDQRSIVYRTGDFTYARDPFASFLDLPGQELQAPLRDGFCSQGDFSAVVETGSALEPDILVEVEVLQLFGDFRQPESPKAVLTMRFTFFAATNGIATQPLFQKEYSQSLPIDKPSATALLSGWDQALTGTLAAVLSDYRQSRIAGFKH
jgi:cholesterol transport system auxiliary component